METLNTEFLKYASDDHIASYSLSVWMVITCLLSLSQHAFHCAFFSYLAKFLVHNCTVWLPQQDIKSCFKQKLLINASCTAVGVKYTSGWQHRWFRVNGFPQNVEPELKTGHRVRIYFLCSAIGSYFLSQPKFKDFGAWKWKLNTSQMG